MGIVKPAIPLSVLWGVTTLTTFYYTTSTHDITHEIYLISSLLMFILEFAAPRSSSKVQHLTDLKQSNEKPEVDVNHEKEKVGEHEKKTEHVE
ncbi:2885_t:CDS:2 [Diversispora eburnea]|uniref:2885_t:CDS:1 n=1 Tax=Diversispora eburnea TaxID=1213867 RepID=A0A9N8VK20_9GLOM|nr:2885_t:CDS:2 [Diversispora eburnea]